jgi:hypothetical protein
MTECEETKKRGIASQCETWWSQEAFRGLAIPIALLGCLIIFEFRQMSAHWFYSQGMVFGMMVGHGNMNWNNKLQSRSCFSGRIGYDFE